MRSSLAELASFSAPKELDKLQELILLQLNRNPRMLRDHFTRSADFGVTPLSDPPVRLAVKGSLGLKGHFPLPDSPEPDSMNSGSCRRQ